jgi:hypothetical protein
MLDLLPPIDYVGDPKAWIAAAVVLFSEYPSEVWPAVVHGVPRGTPRPHLCDLKCALDEAYEPIERQLERERVAQQARLSLPPPRRPRTPEEQALVDAQVEAVRMQFPPVPKPSQAPRIAWGDGRHYERIKDDLEARKARKESAQ